MSPTRPVSGRIKRSRGAEFSWSGKSHPRAFNRVLLSPVSSYARPWLLLLGFSVFLQIVVQLGGCAPKGGTSGASGANRSSDMALFDPSEEVFRTEQAPDSGSPEPGTRSTPEGLEWSIALMTVSGGDHRAIAMSARRDIVERYASLKDIFVDDIKSGSGVFYGRFASPSDPACREAVQKIRALTLSNGQPAFSRVIPARPLSGTSGALHPHDLRSLRAQLGRRHPVYTLQVAQWGTFGDESIDYIELRRKAESSARSLRARGVDAWFHHNSALRLSSVNIGSFGPDAYDPRSTLYAPEVELVMSQFPHLLVNGEPLINPRSGKNQPPFLVEVPR